LILFANQNQENPQILLVKVQIISKKIKQNKDDSLCFV